MGGVTVIGGVDRQANLSMGRSGWIGLALVALCGTTGCGETRRPDAARPALHAIGVAAGDNISCAVEQNGSVWCWGGSAQRVEGLSSGGLIAAGTGYACADSRQGVAWCWEMPTGVDGEVGPPGSPSVVDVGERVVGLSLAGSDACSVGVSGRVYCWSKLVTTPVELHMPTPARQIDGTAKHGCVTDTDGAIWCWGFQGDQPSGAGGTQPAIAVSHFSSFSCALLRSRRVVCWGSGGFGQLGNGAFTGRGVSEPVEVLGITTAEEIHVAAHRACARLEDGSVACWGDNSYGAFGDGTYNQAGQAEPRPVRAGRLPSLKAMSVGENAHACGISQSDEVVCWGNNVDGQLGSGEAERQSGPVVVRL
jgi:alpha-tubulin suppressor-like RCC1 family protein